MKVYIIVADIIDDRHDLGIFSSKKKAEEALKKLITEDRLYKNFKEDLYIEAHEMNSLFFEIYK